MHAGVAAEPRERKKLERLVRYITRPAVSEQRPCLTTNGLVRYELKTPYRDGTTHVFFEPVDFIARLAAPIPKPRVNLIRYHGIFAPNSAHRAAATPAGRGHQPGEGTEQRTPAQRRAAMKWVQRLKRVFDIDITECEACGGGVYIIACIEDPTVIRRILGHPERTLPAHTAVSRTPRGPLQLSLPGFKD